MKLKRLILGSLLLFISICFFFIWAKNYVVPWGIEHLSIFLFSPHLLISLFFLVFIFAFALFVSKTSAFRIFSIFFGAINLFIWYAFCHGSFPIGIFTGLNLDSIFSWAVLLSFFCGIFCIIPIELYGKSYIRKFAYLLSGMTIIVFTAMLLFLIKEYFKPSSDASDTIFAMILVSPIFIAEISCIPFIIKNARNIR